jgi:hypothetical protein
MINEEQIIDEVEAGGGEDLMTKIHKWDKPGDTIIGVLESHTEFESSKYDQKCNRYTLQTNAGRISVVLGAVVDRSLDVERMIGHTLYIKYMGQELTGTGKKMNVFVVKDVTALGSKK